MTTTGKEDEKWWLPATGHYAHSRFMSRPSSKTLSFLCLSVPERVACSGCLLILGMTPPLYKAPLSPSLASISSFWSPTYNYPSLLLPLLSVPSSCLFDSLVPTTLSSLLAPDPRSVALVFWSTYRRPREYSFPLVSAGIPNSSFFLDLCRHYADNTAAKALVASILVVLLLRITRKKQQRRRLLDIWRQAPSPPLLDPLQTRL